MSQSYISLCIVFFPVGPHCVLCHQLDSLEEERATLAAKCEELRLSLQQKENTQEGSRAPQWATDSSAQADTEEDEGTAVTGTDSTSDTFRRLDSWKITPLTCCMNYHRSITVKQPFMTTHQNTDVNLSLSPFSLPVSQFA